MEQQPALADVLHVRLMPEEHQRFAMLAKTLHVSRSRLVRKAIREMTGLGPDWLETELQVFRNTSLQLSGVARNLNQIAKVANSKQDIIYDGLLQAIATLNTSVQTVNQDLRTALMRSQQRWSKPYAPKKM